MSVSRAIILGASYVILAAAMYYFIDKEPWEYREIKIAFNKDRPSPAIPLVILDMQSIAKEGVQLSFQLSAALQADAYIVQRATEFLYPFRIVNEKAPIFAVNADELPLGCRLLSKRPTVALYACE